MTAGPARRAYGRLAGKVALVTGSTRGIGRAIAVAYAAEGASVVVTGRSRDDGSAVERAIREAGGIASYLRMDIGVEEEVAGAVEFAEETYGALTTLVNNAGPTDLLSAGVDGSISDMTTERWERMFRLQLTAPLWAMKYGIAAMKRSGGGSIVNITGTNTRKAGYLACLNAFKGGLDSLSLVAAAEGAEHDIRSNVIAPGLTVGDNAATQAIANDERLSELYLGRQLVKRFATPGDIAQIATWLASDESAMVTGTWIPADGGLLINPGPDFRAREFRQAFAAAMGRDGT